MNNSKSTVIATLKNNELFVVKVTHICYVIYQTSQKKTISNLFSVINFSRRKYRSISRLQLPSADDQLDIKNQLKFLKQTRIKNANMRYTVLVISFEIRPGFLIFYLIKITNRKKANNCPENNI
jgi:hypothetical protein